MYTFSYIKLTSRSNIINFIILYQLTFRFFGIMYLFDFSDNRKNVDSRFGYFSNDINNRCRFQYL